MKLPHLSSARAAHKTGPRRRGQRGYALLTVLLFAVIGLTALASALQWTNQTSMLNERAAESRTALMAAEAATEKVISAMTADFQKGGETMVWNNVGSYSGLVPSPAKRTAWSSAGL